ncbi:MAG: hypothetical protein SOZ80_04575 [Prevotella sp.]|uniref:hypothetical protein n=1 Tax=Prevotella sp. TaxID=59823 RepID=UPI002A2DD53E|nr:hypothetical protein [Prevotella sp.]MDD7319168.1 hypothetical protein [Prevotellaceae bacterium]MDY4020036.1 hypothetical protein [Prevotella sp.]
MTGKKNKEYDEWLATIANTRLLYNTMNELETFVDNHSIHNNGTRRCFGSLQKMRATFRDLLVEASQMTENNVDLEFLMRQYKKAWNFFKQNLSRRSEPQKVALELLLYCYDQCAADVVGKRKREIFDEIMEQCIDIPFVVLMLLKIIPGYYSKEGDATDMAYKYEKALQLLEKFTEGKTMFNLLPAITKAREEKNKTRLTLLYHVRNILNTFEAFISSSNIYNASSYIKQNFVSFDLEGYWNECGGTLQYTAFWEINHAANEGTYFATYWHKNSENVLTGTQYTMFLLETDDDRLLAYIIHPEAIKHRMKGQSYGDKDNSWYITEMPEENNPDNLDFMRFIHSDFWQSRLNLTRVTSSTVSECYDKWMNSCIINKAFGHLEYVLTPNLYAITQNHIYLPTDKEGEFFKIPRNPNYGFDNIQFGDNVGIMKMNGREYIAFDELMIYIKTSKRELDKYGIEIVRRIE